MDKLPNRLQLIDGEISMIDGSDLSEYLQKVQSTWGNGMTHNIVILGSEYAESLVNRALYADAA